MHLTVTKIDQSLDDFTLEQKIIANNLPLDTTKENNIALNALAGANLPISATESNYLKMPEKKISVTLIENQQRSILLTKNEKKLLEDEIEFYNMNLEDAEDDASYYMKANALAKLYADSHNILQKLEAIDCYNKAIELNSEDLTYLVDRCLFYININEFELAKKDMEIIEKLSKPSPEHFSIKESYIKIKLKEIKNKLNLIKTM